MALLRAMGPSGSLSVQGEPPGHARGASPKASAPGEGSWAPHWKGRQAPHLAVAPSAEAARPVPASSGWQAVSMGASP